MFSWFTSIHFIQDSVVFSQFKKKRFLKSNKSLLITTQFQNGPQSRWLWLLQEILKWNNFIKYPRSWTSMKIQPNNNCRDLTLHVQFVSGGGIRCCCLSGDPILMILKQPIHASIHVVNLRHPTSICNYFCHRSVVSWSRMNRCPRMKHLYICVVVYVMMVTQLS